MSRNYNNFSRGGVRLANDPIFTLFVFTANQAVKDLNSPRLGRCHKETARQFLSENADIFQRAGIPAEKIQSLVGGGING